MKQNNFEDTRPYYDDEIPEAIKRISENSYFLEVIKSLFPETDLHAFVEEFRKIRTTKEFQVQVMHRVISSIIKQTIGNFSYEGLDPLTNEKSYMFISNHRDIMLDSALLQLALYESGLRTSEITFGSNLMSTPFIIDIGKINKMFKITRGGTPREIFANSLKVSRYMRYAIAEKHESIWIAQRNGRTKNGHDATDIAVLKMFAMSCKEEFVPNLMELNITPVSISYEYEPCDFLKTRELYISRQKEYVKSPGEDLASILHGIRQWKGGVHLAVCQTITEEELRQCDCASQNEKFKQLSQVIDQRIHSHYRLWKTNYIASDLLHKENKYTACYSETEKNDFIRYMSRGLQGIEGDTKELEAIFLQIYAAPVCNVDR